MTYSKTSQIEHYNGLDTVSKPSNAKTGSTYYEYNTNDTFFTPDGGSTWVVKDPRAIKRVTVIATISANAAYASNDVVGYSSTAAAAKTWDFASMAGYAGGSGKIVQAEIRTNANICSMDPVLFLFNTSSPNSAKADNNTCNAPTHPDVSKGAYLGTIAFGGPPTAYTTSGDAGVILYESASCLPFYYTTSSTDNGIHGILMTATAATFPSKEVAITLYYQRL